MSGSSLLRKIFEVIHLLINTYIYSRLPISQTRKEPGKLSDLSDINNIMQIRHATHSVS